MDKQLITGKRGLITSLHGVTTLFDWLTLQLACGIYERLRVSFSEMIVISYEHFPGIFNQSRQFAGAVNLWNAEQA